MDTGKLVHMANQIASFFRSYPEPEAAAGISEHIHAFWTPGMRAGLAGPPPGLDPLVVLAMQPGPKAENPATKELDGPETAGQLVSDAG